MGLSVDMCHDVEKYEESIAMGLNAKKFLYFAVAAVAGGLSVLLFYKVFKWHIMASVYGMMPISGVIVMTGFYTSNGMTFGQILKRRFKKTNSKPLVYKSTECRKLYEKLNEIETVSIGKTADAQSEINKMLRALKIGAVLFVALIVIIIVVIAIAR